MPRCNTSSEGTAAAATPSPDLAMTDWAAFWRSSPPSLPKKAMTCLSYLLRCGLALANGKSGKANGSRDGRAAREEQTTKGRLRMAAPSEDDGLQGAFLAFRCANVPVGSRQRPRSASPCAVHTGRFILSFSSASYGPPHSDDDSTTVSNV